jgi:hypothetical protein
MYEELVNTLKKMGGKATNKALQNRLGWDKADYLNARLAMLQGGYIRLARGRGGSVLLSDTNEVAGPSPKPIVIKRGGFL